MEAYVYYSIIIFGSFTILLYIYLLFEKISLRLMSNKRVKQIKELEPYIDSLLNAMEKSYPSDEDIKKVTNAASDKIKREVVEDRVIRYMELFTGFMRENIIKFCESTGIVDNEIKNLKGKNYFNIALACKKLGEFRSINAVEPILGVVKAPNVDVRYHALMCLAKIGDTDAFKRGIEFIEEDPMLSERSMIEIVDSFEGDKVGLFKDMINYKNPYISIIFIKSAGNYMDALLGEEISKYIKDEDINKKIAAIKALGQAGDVRYIDEIIECIEDSSWEVRAASAKSLGRLGNGSALKYLSGALTDSQWWVRHNAASALIELPGSMGTIEEVLKGKDRFAKDAVVSAVESSGLLENMKSKEMQHDSDAKRMIEAIKEYHIQRQS